MANNDVPVLVRLDAPGGIDLAMTFESGQVFHWRSVGNGFAGVIGRRGVYVEQEGVQMRCERGAEREVAAYFALDHDLMAIRAGFPDDPMMVAAADYCKGIRILRQPVWECLATFMTSTQKQVAHIRAMSQALREKYGERVDERFGGLHAYPRPDALACAGEAALRTCGLGYRAKNVARAAAMVASGEVDLDRIHGMNDGEAREELCRLPGVGVKVANCVLLFAYGRLAAFPIDVWIDRVLRGIYLKRRRGKVTPSFMAKFAARYFGPNGGYAQQYLFHYARRARHQIAG